MSDTNALSIQPARWELGDEGELFVPLYSDVYASHSSAWERAQSVFVDGSELTSRWQDGRSIRVLEIGFGLGINFLTTWASIKASSSSARLHYVAIEKHPFISQDLRAALEKNLAYVPASLTPIMNELIQRLLIQWPPLISGFHCLSLDDQTTLTLVFGDVESVLPSVHGRFDAFYLDGFAPHHNEVMWSLKTMQHLAGLATEGAIASSWCVASSVQQALHEVGFDLTKRARFGSKRESLLARWPAKLVDSSKRVDS
ncbi:MAG: hypothetical protein RIR21_1234, partial [Pseudomonadota bacterium]